MTLQIEATDGERQERMVWIDHKPRTCPHCNHGVDPSIEFAYLRNDEDKLEVITPCPRVECERLTVSIYDRFGPQEYRFLRSVGTYHPHTEFSDEIKKVSTNFESIYSDAEEAETQGLDEICGPGYRKALEFLVKDYAIFRNPDDADTIARIPSLGTVINNYISDSRIQELAKRAAWLGNDETHYEKRWDMGLERQKALISLVVNYVENELIAEKYIADMPEDGPKSPDEEAGQ